MQNRTHGQILLDLPLAIDGINRTKRWNILYIECIDIPLIKMLIQGHGNTKLRRKHNGTLGDYIRNNVGVSQ